MIFADSKRYFANERGSTTAVFESFFVAFMVLAGLIAVKALTESVNTKGKDSAQWTECGTVLDCDAAGTK